MPARTTARTVPTPAPTRNGKPAAAAGSNGKPAPKRVTFKLAAPEATEVSLCGSFNDWTPGRTTLKRDASGTWKIQVSLAPGTYEYRYVVDGEWRDDPDATWRVPNSFGTENCVRSI